ncbi:hypothetical protein ACFX5U_03495 [Sphingobacterium sp. SG20118]
MMETLQLNNQNLAKITTDFVEISRGLVEGRGVVGSLLTDTALVSSLQQSLQSISLVMAKANTATSNLVLLTEKLNSNKGLVHDLTTDTAVFASLRASAAQLQGVSQTANALMTNLNAASDKLSSKDNAIGTLINDPAVGDQLRDVVRNLNTSTAKLDQNMEALQSNFLLRGFFKKKEKEAKKATEELLKDSVQ